MTDALFLDAAGLGQLVEWVGTWAGVGIGVSAVIWLLGYVAWWVIDVLRGGF